MKQILSVLLAFVFFGCIDDTGNYDYKPSRQLTVTEMSSKIVLTMGETITLSPKVIVKGDEAKKVVENVKLEWFLERKLVSDAASFEYHAMKNGSYDGMLKMTDPHTGAVSVFLFEISVQSKYETGFIILSEENGQSELSFIRSKWLSDPDTIVFEGEWKNIYAIENNGEKLKGKPVSLSEHWANDDYHTVMGEITVMTRDKEKTYVQELNGLSMVRETYLEQEFEGGVVPVGFHPISTMQTCWDSFILDASGLVYMRRSSVKEGYHTGFFSDKVTLYNGQLFTDLIFTQYKKMGAVMAVEKDEKSGKRKYIGIYSGVGGNNNNLLRLSVSTDDPGHFNDLRDEILCSDWRYAGRNSGVSVLMKSPAGEYILHCFDSEGSSRRAVFVTQSGRVNVTEEQGITVVKAMCTNKNFNYTYYCDDHTIYFMDNKYNERYGEMRNFDKKIVTIADLSLYNDSRKYSPALAIGFEDGSIEIWQIDRENPDRFDGRVFTSANRYGQIKSIICKVGSGARFFNQ